MQHITMGPALLYAPFATGINLSALRQDTGTAHETFLSACKTGDLARVKELLATDGQLLTVKDHRGRSGFALALLGGHKTTGELLKQAGYQPDLHETVLDLDWDRYAKLIGEPTAETIKKVNANHPMGGTLMWAAATGGAGRSIWRVYANCGDPDANPNHEKGSSPLQQALCYSDLKVAEMTAATLLSNNADPNPPANAELPPLHLAAQRGSYELVEMLIRLGAIVSLKDRQGRNAASIAAYFGHQRVVDLLDTHEKIPRTCRTSRSAVDWQGNPYQKPDMSDIPFYQQGKVVGAAHGNLEAVKKAVHLDPRMAHSIATTSEKGVEAGAHMGNMEIVKFLLQNGAPYSLPTAVLLNDHSTVNRMLAEDPERIHERGAHDFALLYYPIIGGGNLDVMKLLLDKGARVEEQHFMGTTALHYACIRGPIEGIELLLDHGADINRVGRKFTEEGSTPLQSARDPKIIDYLKSKGAK